MTARVQPQQEHQRGSNQLEKKRNTRSLVGAEGESVGEC